MKAITYQGMKNVKVKNVGDPIIKQEDDIILKVTSTAICGSDLHLIHGMIPNMPHDYIIGHEAMGIVEEAGKEVKRVKKEIVLSYLFRFPADIAGTVNMSFGVSVIIPMKMEK